jgi:hypothetical protein
MKDKVGKNEKIENFRKYGLPKHTKFLYVFTTENFDVTNRPVKYRGCRPMLERVEKQFRQLLKIWGKLPKHQYRFTLLHQIKKFENAV